MSLSPSEIKKLHGDIIPIYVNLVNKITQIKKPSQMLGFAEGSGFYVTASTNASLNRYQDILEYRHTQSLNAVYIDGHTGSLTRNDIPSSVTDHFWESK